MRNSSPVTHAPRSLWEAAHALIVMIFNLFGAPEAIAALHTLQRKERSLILDWLRAGEAMVRHLLLIEASHYPRVAMRTRAKRTHKRERKLMSFEDDQPETWRVSFRCFVSSPACGGGGAEGVGGGGRPHRHRALRADTSPARGGRIQLYSAWPLAERAEAMLRAFNDPEPYARRLARRLHAAPMRAALLTRHPPNLPHMVDDFPLLSAEAEKSRRRIESG